MVLRHVAVTSRSEEKADAFYADLLGLTKSAPKADKILTFVRDFDGNLFEIKAG